ncbi:MAG: hypothetical protein K8M05_13115 [Deltaproteobacteria bacterium]|nr:hypothetical protein [Kofleriaceae bacterium]
MASRLGRTPTSLEFAAAESRAYRELYHHFHTFVAAVEAAGLPAVTFPRKWSRAAVVDELRRLDELGYVLSRRKLIDRGRHDLVNAAATYWGGMTNARRAAGLPPPPRGKRGTSRWSEDEVIAVIKERKGRGWPLSSSRVPRMLRDAATYYFGGWREAIEKAGLDYDQIRLKRAAYSRYEILNTLRALARTHPQMTLTGLHRHRLKSGIERWFSTVDEALRAAKLSGWPRRERRQPMLTATETRALIRARRARGLPMFRTAVLRDDPRLERAGARNFGGWLAALRAAGVEVVSSRGQLTKKNRR